MSVWTCWFNSSPGHKNKDGRPKGTPSFVRSTLFLYGRSTMTKVEAIIALLRDTGGVASWSYIYEYIERYYPNAKASKEWKAGLRGVLYRELRQGKYFKRVDEGVYALQEYNDQETLEFEVKTDVNYVELLRKAAAFSDTMPSHTVKTVTQKIRNENRAQKERVAQLEQGACQVCNWSLQWKNAQGKESYRVEVDHIIPKAQGGGEELSNLWVLCPNCHTKKTVGVLTIDTEKKEVRENGKSIVLHHDNHLGFDLS